MRGCSTPSTKKKEEGDGAAALCWMEGFPLPARLRQVGSTAGTNEKARYRQIEANGQKVSFHSFINESIPLQRKEGWTGQLLEPKAIPLLLQGGVVPRNRGGGGLVFLRKGGEGEN